MQQVTTKLAFSNNNLVSELYANRNGYHEFEVADDEVFSTIESLCSGSSMGASFQDALDWAEGRSETLHNEAMQYKAQGDGYCLPMGYCDYMATPDVVAYETTRGTVFMKFPNAPSVVMIPKSREFGFHHQAIALAMAGLSFARCISLFNIHRHRGEGHFPDSPFATFEEAFQERNRVFDQILVPLGFPPQETWEEHLAEWDRRVAMRGN